jgi:MFS family permease
VPTDSVPRHLAGSAIGFTTMFGEMFGGFVAPIAAGSLASQRGLHVPLWMAAAGAILVFVIALVLRPEARLQESPGLPSGRTYE